MREIVFDTETTGLDPFQGDRLVEIGCIELVNRFPTGKTFHCYFNPERDMPEGAFKVHGLSIDFLKDKPLFADKVDELIGFLGDAQLVAHNAMFDLGFLNAELERAGRAAVNRDRMIDTLVIARRKHPGGSNRLDDLCERYAIDNSRRTKHGALLDAELLAEVYVELIGARQASLVLSQAATPTAAAGVAIVVRERTEPLAISVTDEERAAHRRFIATLGDDAIWRDYISWIERRRCRRCRQALAIELDEIDRVEQQRLEAAVAHRRGDDLARERKQQARAFDQDERLQAVRRHVHDAKHAGEDQLEAVQHQAVGFGLALQTQRHLEVGLAHGRGFDVDLNVDGRLLRARRQRARGMRVLERQILHVLRENADLRHRHLWLGAAICRRHAGLRRARALPAWLTQGREANNAGRRGWRRRR